MNWISHRDHFLHSYELATLCKCKGEGPRWQQIRSPALSSELCWSHVKGQSFNCRMRRTVTMVSSVLTFRGFVRFGKVFDVSIFLVSRLNLHFSRWILFWPLTFNKNILNMCRWLACESKPSIIKARIWIFLTINGWKQYLQCDSMRRTTASRNIARSLCRILVIMLRLLLRILVAWILRMCRNVPVTIALPTHNLHPSARHLARPRPRHQPRLDNIHPVRHL